jgi:polysaccharide export outer membrane protein
MTTSRGYLRVVLGIVTASLVIVCSLLVPTRSHAASQDYTVGPGDLLRITIADAPELGGAFRVSQSGEITVAGLRPPLKVAGKTTEAIAVLTAQTLQSAELLVSPLVSVSIEEYNSRRVTVMGAVNKPAVYSLSRPMTILEVISTAGGLLPNAGEKLTVTRKNQADSRGTESTTTFSLDLAKLMRGEDPAVNINVEAGDVIEVTTAPVVYVIGAVRKPGGFVRPASTSKVSVLQALALAEGMSPSAAADKALIIRNSSSQSRQEIPINLKKLLTTKNLDQAMEPNDILFVPESSMKKSLHAMGAVAGQTISGITIYGVGYRISGLR